MGHRAYYFLIEDESIRCFYNQMDGAFLHEYIFWGPEETKKYLLQCREIKYEISDTWSEGIIVLDFDNKKILYWGGLEFKWWPPVRNLFLSWMNIVWFDWKVIFLYKGVFDVCQYLGYDSEKHYSSLTSFSKGKKQSYNDVLNNEYELSLVSVKWHNGDIKHYHLDDVQHYLLTGPEFLEYLNKESDDFPREEFPSGKNTPPDHPDSYLYINTIKKEVYYSILVDYDYRLYEIYSNIWKGWKLHEHFQGILKHANLINEDFRLFIPNEDFLINWIVEKLTGKQFDNLNFMANVKRDLNSNITSISSDFIRDIPETLNKNYKLKFINKVIELWKKDTNAFEHSLLIDS